MAQEELQGAVPCPHLGDETGRLSGDVGKPLPSGINRQGRGRNQLGSDAGDRGSAGYRARRRHGAGARAHGFFMMSFWVVTIISTIRRQTFSMKVMI